MEERKTYLIPRNYTSFFSLGETIKARNLTEAVVATIPLCKLIDLVPFVQIVKYGAIIILGGICFIVFLVGYNDESIITFLQGYFHHKVFSGVRRIKIPDGKIEEKIEEERTESYAEKFIRRIKRRKD